MVRILRSDGKSSIRSHLHDYVWSVSCLNLSVLLVIILLFSYMITQHKQDREYFLSLNAFYTCLDEVHISLYQLSAGGLERVDETFLVMEEMEKSLKDLQRLKIGGNLQRDVLDLSEMFTQYQKKVVEICQETMEPKGLNMEEAILDYEEAQEIYTYMEKDFKRIYSQLLNFVAKKEGQQYSRNLACLCFCAAGFLMMLRYEMGKANQIAEKIASPVQALVKEAREVESGNLMTRPEAVLKEGACEEINVLSHVFESMLLKIKSQMEEILENAHLKDQMRKKELDNLKISNQLKNSQLKALQMQINPHFLFNTLNMIAKTAYIENAEDTVFLLECTASLLRYTLDHAMRAVTLEKEMEMLGNYVYIQERRFGKRIYFEFDLQESFNQVQVPSLILQPILENAITHGLGLKVSGGKIRIHTEEDKKTGMGMVSIRDNGCGMEREVLTQVIEDMKNGKNSSDKIGLENVYMRLSIFYQGRGGMDLISIPGEGTEVRILIPTSGREEEVEENV